MHDTAKYRDMLHRNGDRITVTSTLFIYLLIHYTSFNNAVSISENTEWKIF
jgi:hypothetical protein